MTQWLHGAAVAGAIAALSSSGPAAAAPAPDALAALRTGLRHGAAVVWAGDKRFELPHAVLDSTGAWSRDASVYRPRRVAVVQAAGATGFVAPPRPIAWEAIDSIAVVRRGAGAPAVLLLGTVVGAVVGLAVGGAILANATHSSTHDVGLAVAIPGVVAGVLAAAIVLPKDHVRVVWRAAPGR